VPVDHLTQIVVGLNNVWLWNANVNAFGLSVWGPVNLPPPETLDFVARSSIRARRNEELTITINPRHRHQVHSAFVILVHERSEVAFAID
jgi:hypothetical protein